MYSFSSHVRYSECDENAQLGIVALMNYLQDTNTFQTESLGLGLDHMARHHFAWLLAAWQIEIDRLPHFCDPITVNTWCYEMKRTYSLRNYTMSGPDGVPFVRADAIWFTYGLDEGRPIRIPESEMVYLSDVPRLDMPVTQRKLKAEGQSWDATPITVNEQHLDTNRHVNNAQYVLMALQSLGEEVTPHRICVQYRRQAVLGDVLVPRIHANESGWTVELVDGQTDPTAVDDTFAIIRLEA